MKKLQGFKENAKTLKYNLKEAKRLNALILTYLQTSTRSPSQKKSTLKFEKNDLQEFTSSKFTSLTLI